MFIAALFTITKVWKQLCPLTDKDVVHTHTHTNWNTTQPYKSKMFLFAVTWMDLENIMLTEVSQTEKRQILYDITYISNLKSTTN